jgi:hypothetical protein
MTNTRSFHSRFPVVQSLAAGLAAAAIALAPAAGYAASKIGIAAQIQNQVNALLGSDNRTLRLGNDVFAGDRIRTGQSSNAQLTFVDQTNLTIGSQSDVVLDRFVFDPNRGVGDVTMTTTQGALRFISGSQNPATYKVNTPVATIAIRGTLAYSFIFGGMEYIVNGYGHVTAVLLNKQSIDIPPGYALVLPIPADPAHPQGTMIKWQLGLLDLDRLAQLLPQFEDQPDGLGDLTDQHNDADLPPFCYYCYEG